MQFFALKKILACQVLLMSAFAAQGQDSTAEDWLRNPSMGNYKAYAEFKMAHYANARHIWETLAGVGNADALFNLAILAEDGLGEPRDIRRAVALYVTAANAGGFKAQYRLGMLYSTGGAIDQDAVKARQYLSLAAAHGDRDAIERLAALDQPDRPLSTFEEAEILSSAGRHAEAAVLYRRTADSGNLAALSRLAWMYEAGRGVERDLAQAAQLFMQAAQGGDGEAQYATAVMYRTGRGQPKDREQSLRWFKRAAEQKYPAAVAALAAQTDDR